VILRLFKAHNPYEKILAAYLAFVHLMVLMTTTATISLSAILDIVLVLFLLILSATSLLILRSKKIGGEE
jgi:hypothetical protein